VAFLKQCHYIAGVLTFFEEIVVLSLATNKRSVFVGAPTSFLRRSAGLAWLFAIILLTACGGGSSSSSGTTPTPPPPQTGTVSGTVISATTGAAISGATLRAGTTTVTSAADGSYTLPADVSERAIISISATGFAETYKIARLTTGPTLALEVQLVPTGVTQSVTVAAGGTVTVRESSAQITIPAGALVSTAGGTPAATVNVSLTPINPAIDSSVMPGDFTAVLSGSTAPVPIESFGALNVDARDASGTRYTLAAGQTATLRIPLGTLSAAPPPTIPLLIFNETTGLWVEEGTATLAGTAQNRFYTGTVTRFGSWNADQALNTVLVTGCVRDTANQPVANVSVRADGINYSGSSSTFTAVDGGFRLAIRREGLVTLSATFALTGKPVTTTIDAGPFTGDATLPSCIETAPPPLQISARSRPPAGTVGTPYNARLAAANGTQPYSWSVIAGALPVGLALTANGQISGTPTIAGTFPVTIQAQDNSTPPQRVNTPFSLAVLSMPTPPPSTGTVRSVAVGGWHTCALLSNGTVRCWGLNERGQLGNGTTNNSFAPVTVRGVTAATAVAAGYQSTCAVLVSGAVQCWGYGASRVRVNAVMADSSTPVTVSGIATATSVAMGSLDPCALLANSTVQCWEFTVRDALGDGATGDSSLPVTVSGIATATAVTSGDRHTCAVLASGAVQCWGHGASGALGSGDTADSSLPVTVSGIATATSVTAGQSHTCVLLASGSVQCWGYGASGALWNGVKFDVSPPVTVSGIATATSVTAGKRHTCAVLASGATQCWGYNDDGQLGNGTTITSSTPVTVTGVTTATAVAAHNHHTCAVLSNGTIQCWGLNDYGQLGNGTKNNSSTPVQVIKLP